MSVRYFVHLLVSNLTPFNPVENDISFENKTINQKLCYLLCMIDLHGKSTSMLDTKLYQLIEQYGDIIFGYDFAN